MNSQDMQRYYFDVDDGNGLVHDSTGLECPSRQAMRLEAMKTIPDVIRDMIPESDEQTFCVLVRDHTGTEIFEARFALTAHWL